MTRRRLDAEVVGRGLVSSRTRARRLIEAGQVLVDGVAVTRPSQPVPDGVELAVVADAGFVSRGGDKLDAALTGFGIDVAGARCLDAGASTGGFTDCLLRRGAVGVVAVDVGTDQLHPDLVADPRVVSLERTDVRSLAPAVPVGLLGGPVDLVVADLSFVSLRVVLPALAALAAGAPIVALVKPQFETGPGRGERKRGVVRSPVVWRRTLGGVVEEAGDLGLVLQGATVSPITGSAGNIEFLVRLGPGPAAPTGEALLDEVVATAEAKSP